MTSAIQILRELKHDRSGTIAVQFVLAITVILITVGAAIDITIAHSKKSDFQDLADIAVLAAVTSQKEKKNDLLAIAKKAVVTSSGDESLIVTLDIIDGKVFVNVSQTHDNPMLKAFGKKVTRVSAVAAAPLVSDKKVNIALVLDTTASMRGARMTALKEAATELVNQVEKDLQQSGDVNISLVPFSDYVRISPDLKGERWLEVEDDKQINRRVIDKDKSTNCRTLGQGERSRLVCDKKVYKNETVNATWVGCMGSRRNDGHKLAEYKGDKMQGFASGNTSCDTHYNILQPLNSNLSKVKTEINALETYGRTYIPSGIIWGWRTLSPQDPFSYNDNVGNNKRRKVMILMSDGMNTKSLRKSNGKNGFQGYYHSGTSTEDPNAFNKDAAKANPLTVELCKAAKADEIEIFTVAFEVTDAATKDMMKACATSNGNYYDAKSGTALKKAFTSIANSLDTIRLTH